MTPGFPDTAALPGVFLHGSCVSRDTFEWLRADFTLTDYVARQSLISVNRDASAVLPDETGFDSAFQEQMRRGDLAGNALMRLRRAAPRTDLLLLDLCDERLGVYDLGEGRFVTNSVERAPRGRLPFPLVEFGSDQHFGLWREAFDWWLERVGHIVPQVPVAVLAPSWATSAEDGSATPPSYEITAEQGNALYERYYDHLRQHGLLLLGTQIDVVASTDHRWGAAPFHYADSVYEALVAEIRAIPRTARATTTEEVAPGSSPPREPGWRPVTLSAPATRYASLTDLVNRQYEPLGTLEVEHHGLPLHVSFSPRDAPVTLVSFAGPSASQQSVPLWIGRPKVGDLVVNSLQIADPSLILSDHIKVAWFAGNSRQPDLPDALTELITSLAGDTRVVLYGAGSTAFAALSQASSIPGSRAVVVNPQTDLAQVPGDDRTTYLSACWGIDVATDDWTWPVEHSVAGRWQEPLAAEVVVLQDARKQRSVERQFRPFVDRSHPENLLLPLLLRSRDDSPVPPSDLRSDIIGLACSIESWPEFVDAVGTHLDSDRNVDPESPHPPRSKDSS